MDKKTKEFLEGEKREVTKKKEEEREDIGWVNDETEGFDLGDEDDDDSFDEISWDSDEDEDETEEREGYEEEILDLPEDDDITYEEPPTDEDEDVEETELWGTEPEEDFPFSVEVTDTDIEEEDLEIEDIGEDVDFSGCVHTPGMSIEDFLRKNPNKRDVYFVEHFYDKSEIDSALLRGHILVKKGIFKI